MEIQGGKEMCLALYLAAAQELPVIAWDDSNPGFHVIRLPKSAEAVRKHLGVARRALVLEHAHWTEERLDRARHFD